MRQTAGGRGHPGSLAAGGGALAGGSATLGGMRATRRSRRSGLLVSMAIAAWAVVAAGAGAVRAGDPPPAASPGGSPAAPAALPAVAVRPLAAVLLAPPELLPDPSGRAIAIRAHTTIPLVCSVVYGPDDRYGGIATGTGMGAAGGMTDHELVIGGLTPGSVLHLRLQGTAADGTIHVGEPTTITLPVPAAGAGADLAAGATIAGVSSEWSAAYGAANAIDGDPATEWSSRGDGDDAWIELDLGAPREIASVTWVTRSMADGSAVTTSVTVAADGTVLGTFPADAPARIGISARILRLDVASSTGGNTGAREILVTGPAASSDPSSPVP